MAKPSKEKGFIEAERLRILHEQQTRMRRRIKREVKVKKASPHLPGEERTKKTIAVLLKVGFPNISNKEIGSRIGETKTTVKDWFRVDPEVKELYETITNNLKEGSISLLETYGLEAVETLVILMRFGSEKYMFESAKDILDRVGVAKVSKQEFEGSVKRSHEWADRDALVEEIRSLPPELQDEAIEVVEKLEEMLAGHSGNGSSSGELKPINGSEENDEEAEDD